MKAQKFSTVLAFGFFAATFSVAGQAGADAEIHGTAKDCWQGKVIPVRGITVYAYDMEKGKPVFEVLEKINQIPNQGDSPEALQKYFEKFNPLYEELIRRVEESREQRLHTNTNERGEFVFHKLLAGHEYLILAIDPEVEDQVSYYEYIVTERLKPGTRTVKLWMAPDTEEACRDSGQ